MLTRREFLHLMGGAGMTLSASGCAASSLPLRQDMFPLLEDQKELFLGLATSLPDEHDYEAKIEGKIPGELRGTLYRNTAGLFERQGLRKRTMLDGDGMIQAFRFHDQGVHYRNKYVMTEKYRDESAAGRYIYPTFSTQAPGGTLANFWAGQNIKSQANISAAVRNGKLYAFDESTLPYALDPDTLETTGFSSLGLPPGMTLYGAHPKIDPRTGEWLHAGLHYGKDVILHITVFHADGSLRYHRTIPLPRYVHMHDFFATERYLIFSIHPMKLKIFGFLFGLRSVADCLRWEPQDGNLLLIVRRDESSEPWYLTTDPCFMWHSINAHEQGDEIIAEFVGYKNPDHLIGEDPPVYAVMTGRKGHYRYPGEIRQYRIDTRKRSMRQEIIHHDNYEWPAMNLCHRCHPYRYAYLARARGDDFFWSGITRFDTESGRAEDFMFEEGLFCAEPLFAPVPGFSYDAASGDEPGWLLTMVYNGHTKKSFLAVLRADHVSDGPVASVHLNHHAPYSMHGFWCGSATMDCGR